MKLHHKIKHITAIILIFCSIIICSPVARAESTTISPEEALTLSLFYYYGNLSEKDESPTIDSYFITPLYDENNTILHYCIDFFNKNEGKGYVIIAADISYSLCPELAYDGNSEYYLNEQDGYNNIYYNPFERFLSSKKSSNNRKTQKNYDLNRKEIPKSKVTGSPISGKRNENKKVKDTVDACGADVPTTVLARAVFSEDPSVFLSNLGFGNITCTSYTTMENEMRAAGALNPMYNKKNSTIRTYINEDDDVPIGVPFSDEVILYNMDHCAITAIANVLRYWKSVCCPNYPETYNELFKDILETCDFFNVFDYSYIKTSDDDMAGYFSTASIDDMLLAVNDSYRYHGRVAVNNNGSWAFLRQYLQDYDWPIIIAGFGSSPSFTYRNHAIVSFAYTIMRCEKGANAYQFRFIKVADGYSSSTNFESVTPRYLSWDMVENSDLTPTLFAFCPYGGTGI